ncbi:unnamed protein product [Moneuplotes crassus]|uniref:Uncharacterized protein n=1 Tax=Euplotes crassus TaxID=5936 RepID=A0AAD1XLG7_EUPCR|nr:unnamed protein product [Moneuplotes crassus]
MASPLIVSLICFGYLVKTIVSRAKKMKCKKSPKIEKLKTPRRGHEQEEDKSEAHHGNSAMRFESSIARSHANINRPSRRQDRNIHQHFRRRINHYNRMMGKRAELNISKNT